MKCQVCGDIRLAPGHWAGLRDVKNGQPAHGAMSLCEDRHQWVSVLHNYPSEGVARVEDWRVALGRRYRRSSGPMFDVLPDKPLQQIAELIFADMHERAVARTPWGRVMVALRRWWRKRRWNRRLYAYWLIAHEFNTDVIRRVRAREQRTR